MEVAITLIALIVIILMAAAYLLIKFIMLRSRLEEDQSTYATVWVIDRDPNTLTIEELSRCTHKLQLKKRSLPR